MKTHSDFYLMCLAYLAFSILWLFKTPVDFTAWVLASVDQWLDKQLTKVLGD